MRNCIGVCVCSIGLVLLGVTPTWGAPTFSYTTDFESDADGATPLGWVVSNSGNDMPLFIGSSNNPKVMAADTPGWEGISILGAAGKVNYAVPWSGGKRFAILHSGWDYNAAFASGATFTGTGATYSGTYPMSLQANSFKAVFDLAMRSGRTGTTTHGFVFTVQPIEDAQNVRIVGEAFGREGYDQNGFGVEVDIFNNSGGGGNGFGDPDNKHVGVELYRMWDIAGSFSGQGITVPSLKTNVEQGVTVPFPNPLGNAAASAWCSVGDNNQPLHFTVYYNDPDKGGLGVVRVYLKVDPATKAAGDPAVPSGQTPFSFGFDVGDDPVDGKLMVEVCVGAWPTSGAAFGFVAGRSGSTHVAQVDNVHVETNAVGTGTVCTVPDLAPAFAPGAAVAPPWTATPVQTDLTGMTQPGWDVTSYLDSQLAPGGDLPQRLDVFKGAIRAQTDAGFKLGSAVGEPSLNYWTAGGGGGGLVGNIGDNRLPPGMTAGSTFIGILAKGWIYFPVGNTDYDLCMNADNGYEVMIGDQVVFVSVQDGSFSSGLNGGGSFTLHVDQAGVYPIQILWFDWGGGAYCEFYRRTNNPMIPFLLVGNTTWGLADQPLVFGLRNGVAAPDHIDDYTIPASPFTPVTLSPTQKAAGVGTGTQAFNIKSVWIQYPNFALNQNGGDDDARQTALNFLEALPNLVPGATAPTVNFRGVGEGDGPIAGGVDFPGIASGAGQYGLRADGFIAFPAPGRYILGLAGDDDIYLRLGNQTVINSVCCGSYLAFLDVIEAGTYPIRVELLGYGSPNYIDLYELAPGAGGYSYVAVNSPQSSVQVWTSATSGDFPWKNQLHVLPPERKVADVGQGSTLGWNATLVKAPPGVSLEQGLGIATMMLENDFHLFGAGIPAPTFGYDTPPCINLADIGKDPVGEFSTAAVPVANQTADLLTSRFLMTGGTPIFTATDNFHWGVRFEGYIEFSVPGDYIFETNTSDGAILWIGGVPAAQYYDNSWVGPNTPAPTRVAQAGIYDVRVDFYKRDAGSGTAQLEITQLLPDRLTHALVNDPNDAGNPTATGGRARVYQSLTVPPATTVYKNLAWVPASGKVAEINRGGDSGARFQIVTASFLTGDGNNSGVGQDKFKTFAEMDELLGTVLFGVPSYSQYGSVTSDSVVPTINWSETASDRGYRATRTTGYLALTAGGHLLDVNSDDGSRVTIAGKLVAQSGPQHGAYPHRFYINVEADGLYPFEIDHVAGGPPNQIAFNEITGWTKDPGSGAVSMIEEPVNTGGASKMYVNVTQCHAPWLDIDGDQDVDQDDFGKFQVCFTGDAAATLAWPCTCFDRVGAGAGDSTINATDYATFMSCWTGPRVVWSASVDCPE